MNMESGQILFIIVFLYPVRLQLERDPHIVLVGNFEKNPQKVPRCGLMGVAWVFWTLKRSQLQNNTSSPAIFFLAQGISKAPAVGLVKSNTL